MKEEELNKPFEIILYAGNSQASSMKAMELCRKGFYEEAEKEIEKAEEETIKAHHVHTALLQETLKNASDTIPMITAHAQDHLMMATVLQTQAKEILCLYKKIEKLTEGKK